MDTPIKILCLTKGSLPFPPYKGGAIESLLYSLVKENEKEKIFHFTIISSSTDQAAVNENFDNTSILYCLEINRVRILFRSFLNKVRKKIVKKILGKHLFLDDYPEILNEAKKIDATQFDIMIDFNCDHRIDKLRRSFCGKRIVYLHNDYINKKLFKGKQILKNIDSVITVSNFLSDKVSEVDKSTTTIKVNNGIDIAKFNWVEDREKKNLRSKHSIHSSDIVLVFNGRLHKTKGVHRILEVLNELDFKKKIHLFVIGGTTHGVTQFNSYYKKVKKMADNSKYPVYFTGHIPHEEVIEIVSMADLVICPSSMNETCCLSMVEAQQMGIPVIVTAIGGIPEYYLQGGGALLDKDNITLNLKEVLHALIETENILSLKEALSNKRNQYTESKMYREFEQAIMQTINYTE